MRGRVFISRSRHYGEVRVWKREDAGPAINAPRLSVNPLKCQRVNAESEGQQWHFIVLSVDGATPEGEQCLGGHAGNGLNTTAFHKLLIT